MKFVYTLTAALLLPLFGCETKEEVVTVDWYIAHDTERAEKIKACENNPGELMSTPNCINAISAVREARKRNMSERLKSREGLDLHISR